MRHTFKEVDYSEGDFVGLVFSLRIGSAIEVVGELEGCVEGVRFNVREGFQGGFHSDCGAVGIGG